MSINVVAFLRPRSQVRDWDNGELAEFYRVEASLLRGGIPLDTERGLSDEGEPWFVFCHRDTGDVIIHFARIDGDYVVANPALQTSVRGRQFRPLIQSLIDKHPIVVPGSSANGKLVVHPAALLIALVALCFYKLGHADSAAAAEMKSEPAVPGAAQSSATKSVRGVSKEFVADEGTSSAALGVIAVATAWLMNSSDNLIVFESSSPLLHQVMTGAMPAMGWAESSTWMSTAVHASVSDHVYADAVSDSDMAGLTPKARLLATAGPSIVDLAKFVAQDTHAVTPQHEVVTSPAPTMNAVVTVAPAHVLATVMMAANGSVALQEVEQVLGASLEGHHVENPTYIQQALVLGAAAGEAVQFIPPAQTAPDGGTIQSAVTSTSQAPAATSTPPTSAAVSGSAGQPAITVTHSTSAYAAAPSANNSTDLTIAVSDANKGIAEAAILQFLTQYPDFQVLTSGKELILYDPHINAGNVSASFHETLSFSDGSSVFLMGVSTATHAPPLGA